MASHVPNRLGENNNNNKKQHSFKFENTLNYNPFVERMHSSEKQKCLKSRVKNAYSTDLLGDGLGTCPAPWATQAHGRLDLRCEGRSLYVNAARLLSGYELEDAIDIRVHDDKGLGRDARVWVHLLQHLVHVSSSPCG